MTAIDRTVADRLLSAADGDILLACHAFAAMHGERTDADTLWRLCCQIAWVASQPPARPATMAALVAVTLPPASVVRRAVRHVYLEIVRDRAWDCVTDDPTWAQTDLARRLVRALAHTGAL